MGGVIPGVVYATGTVVKPPIIGPSLTIDKYGPVFSFTIAPTRISAPWTPDCVDPDARWEV